MSHDVNCGRLPGGKLSHRCTCSAPLAQRLRDAADAIEELACLRGLNAHEAGRTVVNPTSLRREAELLDNEAADV